MKKQEVPQDHGLTEGLPIDICYALDENGNYVKVVSSGWQPKTDAMLQAWEVINDKIEEVRQQVLSGELSPIAYFMEKSLMDVKLLADYTGFSKRKVRKHLQPGHFIKLEDTKLARYAEVFEIEVEVLKDFIKNNLKK
jgi:hypothetical protein